MPVHAGVAVWSVAAQEEGVAGCSSQAVAQPADARTVFQGAALAHVALGDTDQGLKVEVKGGAAGAQEVSVDAALALEKAPENIRAALETRAVQRV